MYTNKGFLAKARAANVWVVERQSATEAVNLFMTHDFRTYTPLTNVQPQRAYNWLTAELVHWTAPDGLQLAGILYKPENFDPQKIYPLIVSIYEEQSDEFTRFPIPALTNSGLNVPYFVSRGYLVFLPDIVKRRGQTGASALDAVTSGVRRLTARPYVDRMHVGLMGHSYGGFETNYIVTRTSMFAAAVASAGPADLVSGYGSLRGNTLPRTGETTQGFYEDGQPQMGAPLWPNPQRYLANSPIFRADRVTTPLLLIHNQQDGSVPFQQGIEWFSALRRVGKRVWMLQYDQGQHGVSEARDQRDVTQRLQQFFDHYLKGAPAPIWMTRGIPAWLKGVETGLASDTTGHVP
jgi:dipeptidyl aminopeptidase/acylaminoacyl peptidase